MFIIAQSDSYFWPVVVEFPGDGKKEKQEFKAQFKRVSQDKIKEIGSAIDNDLTNDEALCKEMLVGWDGIATGSGEKIPYSEEARDKLLKIHLVAGAIVRSWLDSIRVDQKAKN